MADFTMTVFADATNTSLGAPIQEIGLAVTTPAVLSDPVSGSGRQRRKVRLATSRACHWQIGSSPLATADSARLAAGGVEYIEMEAGQRISVLAAV